MSVPETNTLFCSNKNERERERDIEIYLITSMSIIVGHTASEATFYSLATAWCWGWFGRQERSYVNEQHYWPHCLTSHLLLPHY